MTKIKLRSPIWWLGGKGNMLRKLLPILEGVPHKRYCEPFGGGASVLLAKQPVELEIYNDIDSGLYDLFKVLSDPDLFAQFERRVALLPCSRQFYNEYRQNWRNEKDLIKRVSMWFLVARQSFGGRFGSGWSSVVTKNARGMAATSSGWLSIIELLPEIHARLQRVQIENADWRVILERYDTPETLFYLDPPYIASTRRSRKYQHELRDNDHIELVDRLLALQGHGVLSGYPNAIYKRLEERGWQTIKWQTAAHAAGRTRTSNLQGKGAVLKHQARTECVWISPKAVEQLKAVEQNKNLIFSFEKE